MMERLFANATVDYRKAIADLVWVCTDAIFRSRSCIFPDLNKGRVLALLPG